MFQESIKLTQELLAAVDEGELATVVKLLKNPELSVNVINKVKKKRERGGEEGEKGRDKGEGWRERGRLRLRERCLIFSLSSPHSMEKVLCT